MMKLPGEISEAVKPIWECQPLEGAMTQLVVTGGGSVELTRVIEAVSKSPALLHRPRLMAGLWLYADDLDRSHSISKQMDDATGAFWHGIMHRREGDFGNSHYWFRKVGNHPVTHQIAGYDPHSFIDDVESRYRDNPDDLVALQQEEWKSLFEWCANVDVAQSA